MMRHQRTLITAIALTVSILMVCWLSISLGSRTVGIRDITAAFTTDTQTITLSAIRLRVPRTALGLLVGAGLGVAGALLQGMSRNPLADPSILGLNSGAAFAIVCAIAFADLSTPIQYVWVAMAGSALTALLVWFAASIGRFGPTPMSLTLAGAVISAMLTSFTSAILLPRVNVINSYRFWQVGGISGARFSLMLPMLPILIIGFVLALASAHSLDALALGDELAAGLGTRVSIARAQAWLAAILLCSSCTALAGPIGFVGLVVPHAARLITGSDYRRIMPASALIGALLLVFADVVGRVVTRPADVEVGIVTALIGAPIFVWLTCRRTQTEV